MRFLVDECTGPAVASLLQEQGHDVFSVFEHARGMPDDDVLRKAAAEGRILVTNDKDFGDKVYREHRGHCGVVLLRLRDERSAVKEAVMRRLLDEFGDELPGSFVVATETSVRFAGS